MSEIKVERKPGAQRLSNLGVERWPIWTHEVAEFPWSYDAAETCYFLEGDVVVTPDGGQPVEMAQGDLVTFAAGLSCTWKIRKSVRKRYRLG